MPLKFSGYKDSRTRYEWNEWNRGQGMVDVSVDYCSAVLSSLTGRNRRQKHNEDYSLYLSRRSSNIATSITAHQHHTDITSMANPATGNAHTEMNYSQELGKRTTY